MCSRFLLRADVQFGFFGIGTGLAFFSLCEATCAGRMGPAAEAGIIGRVPNRWIRRFANSGVVEILSGNADGAIESAERDYANPISLRCFSMRRIAPIKQVGEVIASECAFRRVRYDFEPFVGVVFEGLAVVARCGFRFYPHDPLEPANVGYAAVV
jgi:hypothetical protein